MKINKNFADLFRKGLPVVFVEIFFWYWEVLSFKSLYIYWSSFDPGWEF